VRSNFVKPVKKVYNLREDHESKGYAITHCYLMVVHTASAAYISRFYEVVAFVCIACIRLVAL